MPTALAIFFVRQSLSLSRLSSFLSLIFFLFLSMSVNLSFYMAVFFLSSFLPLSSLVVFCRCRCPGPCPCITPRVIHTSKFANFRRQHLIFIGFVVDPLQQVVSAWVSQTQRCQVAAGLAMSSSLVLSCAVLLCCVVASCVMSCCVCLVVSCDCLALSRLALRLSCLVLSWQKRSNPKPSQ